MRFYQVILSRTADGVAALDVFCTHRRNKLTVSQDGTISCPVHSSIFNGAGKPVSGPATKELAWYLTSIEEDGAISVDVST
jgi:Rieske Fe-S protein